MPVPDFQSMMLPVLKILSDGQPHSRKDVAKELSKVLKLTSEELAQLLPSGRQTRFDNRLAWVQVYLNAAGLTFYPERGSMQITERGKKVLKEPPSKIDIRFLLKFSEFQDFRARKKPEGDRESQAQMMEKVDAEEELTPEETIEKAYQQMRSALAQELLDIIKKSPSTFFERMVVDFVLALGYGGSRKDAGEALGRSGDGGVDGVIKEDRLGLDVVYLQAKRWTNPIGANLIREFAGSLEGYRAKKGILITTSSFTKEALEYALKIEKRISLVDGKTLVDMMIDVNLGVSTTQGYELKKVDLDYFPENL